MDTEPIVPPRTAGARPPRGLLTLWGVEMWERFSFYGMRAILVLFLAAPAESRGLGLAPHIAAAVFGMYGALVNLLALPGGWLADRLWGSYRAVVWGGVVIAAGHAVLAVPGGVAFAYTGLLLVAAGTGLLKPGISTMVGRLYDSEDGVDRTRGEDTARRDAGFSLFYMGISIGAFAAPLITGYLGERINWHAGFGAAAVGMLIGLVICVRGRGRLPDAPRAPVRTAPAADLRRMFLASGAAVVFLAVVFALCVLCGQSAADGVIQSVTLLTIAVPLVYFVVLFRTTGLDPVDRSRLGAYVWIFLAASVFWMIAEQGGSLISLFARDHVDRDLFGWEFPTSWFQSLGPLYSIVLATAFAALWLRLGSRQPSTAAKFSLGLFGLGVATLITAGAAAAADGGRVTPLWLIVAFFVQIMAEMCLSPTGLSVTTRLAPSRFANQIMSLWFLSVAMGSALSAQVVRLTTVWSPATYFAVLATAALLCSAGVALARKRLRHLMRGVT
ncbi:oligopeptide:H+ symporter [Streptomyces sp. 4503]|uniref:Oligopeptide:H+ symporter n=1 Tax=Streptomyces niphimycinicus TaxID=2842201 RepID=A0ABS6CLM6_9ACTN|nr:oligopeptide:H+ symporter [Streptomyces niphimycinicus]MBU3867676.1 oligopeptide:H+ symporter [Streptomyces niphimycinicus]